MKRNPELAHQVTLMPEIKELRHTAIDKITSASLAAGILGRRTGNITAEEELEIEIRLNELLDEAGYTFRKYLRAKVTKYEEELHKTLEKGNKAIIEHSAALDQLKLDRGLQ